MCAMELPIKLYKYKALRPFEHVADILLKNRFHTAQFFDLNDPMEGLFNYEQGTKQEYLGRIRAAKEQLRICAFSKDPENPVLWAHYADGLKGICIEIEVTETDGLDYELVEVEYSDMRTLFSNRAAKLTDMMAEIVLGDKAEQWSIEQEVRALAIAKYIPISYGVKLT